MPITVLVTAPTLAPAGVKILQDAGCRVLFEDNAAGIAHCLATEPIDAVISRTADLSGDFIRSCPSLKVISKHGVGVNNIDVAAATSRRIPVFFTASANAQSVAEMTIGLMLSVARGIVGDTQRVRAGQWVRDGRSLQLSGRRLGIVGFGQIGQRVATIGSAMGMKVFVFDPSVKDSALPVTAVTSLNDLLKLADVLSLHVPLSARTKDMIGASQLAMMPRDGILINTARGGIVDEVALAAALKAGHLFGAGLDSLTLEPPLRENPLLAISSVVLTPHVAGSTEESLAAVATVAVENALRFLRGETVEMRSCANPDALGVLSP